MKKKIIFAFGLTMFLAQPSWALEEIMKNYRGIRSLGMGGVVTTTGLYDESLFGNPATSLQNPTWKLSLLNVTAEANTNFLEDFNKVSKASSESGTGVISKISDEGIAGRNEHSRLTMLMPAFYSPHFFSENTSFSIGLLFNLQTNIMLHQNVVVDTQTIADVGPNVGIAHRYTLFDSPLDVGINLHGIYRLAGDKSLRATSFLAGQKISLSEVAGQGLGIDGDVGVFYKLPFEPPFFKAISVGASINNVAGSEYRVAFKDIVKKATGAPPVNDRSFNMGVRADLPDALIFTDNLFAIEMQNIGELQYQASFFKRIHFGGETHLTRFLAFRAGLNQGYVGAGVGINLPLFKFDVATYGEELGSNAGQLEDRRVLVRVALEI
ncbi:MAG: hypothetical protein AB1540_10020 [Bdellovibrionota bacterium]